jgi:hypothetical protein
MPTKMTGWHFLFLNNHTRLNDFLFLNVYVSEYLIWHVFRH